MRASISVLMAVHNGERYLKAAVSSILKQSFKDFQFVIIDDGSTDRTGAILSDFSARDSRIQCFKRPHSGLSMSLNFALSEARGDLIARMDSDDISHPSRFELQVAFLERNEEVVCVGSLATYVNFIGWRVGVWKVPRLHNEICESLKSGNPGQIIHPSAMIRRKSLIAVGGYDENLTVAQDYDLFIRLSHIGRLENLYEPLLKYRLHRSSVSSTCRLRQRAIVLEICNRHRKLDGLNPLEDGDLKIPNADLSSNREIFLAAKRNRFFHTAALHLLLGSFKGEKVR